MALREEGFSAFTKGGDGEERDVRCTTGSNPDLGILSSVSDYVSAIFYQIIKKYHRKIVKYKYQSVRTALGFG